jgi:hypothetical protein
MGYKDVSNGNRTNDKDNPSFSQRRRGINKIEAICPVISFWMGKFLPHKKYNSYPGMVAC